MKKAILLLFLLPTIAFGQTTLIPEKLQEPTKELPGKHLSIGNNTTAWVDTTVEYCSYNWDTLSGAWLNDYRETYAYDSNGNLIEYIGQDWDGSAWVNDRRDTYTYDSNGNMIEYVYQGWDGSAWVTNGKYAYAYDSNGNEIELIRQTWNGSTWVNDYRYTYTYDSNGNMIEGINQGWTGLTWVASYRYTYTYDSNGNQIEEISQTWDGSGWVNDGRYVLCDYVATITEQQPTSLFVYPNPVKNYLVVQPKHPSTLTLYNAQGQLLLTKEITTTHTLNTSHLSKGIYFLKAISEKGVYSQKVIKQ